MISASKHCVISGSSTARILVSGKSVRCGVAALCETADMPTMRWTVWTLVCTLTHASQHAHTDIGIFMVKGGIK